MDNEPVRQTTPVLSVVIAVLAVVTAASSAVLTVTPFCWLVEGAQGGVDFDVLGGFVWPIARCSLAG